MSDAVGPMAVLPADGSGPLLPGVSESPAATQAMIDLEVRQIVEEAYAEVVALLREPRASTPSPVALLVHETLDAEAAYLRPASSGPARLRSAACPSRRPTRAPAASDARRVVRRLQGPPDRSDRVSHARAASLPVQARRVTGVRVGKSPPDGE